MADSCRQGRGLTTLRQTRDGFLELMALQCQAQPLSSMWNEETKGDNREDIRHTASG